MITMIFYIYDIIGLYDTLSALISSVFPRKYYYEGYSIINFIFGIAGLFGLKKVVKFFGNNVQNIFL